jgi:CRISPR-associated protein Cmr6
VESWEDGSTGDLSGKVQKPAVEGIVQLSRAAPTGFDWNELASRRAALLDSVGAVRTPCVTTGPLTLHLARASALENAGICLHRVYGFAYLPGSGLKGLARAYAESAANCPKSDLEAIFGTTDGAGRISFHDAWPAEWPRLVADIVNNHHKKYYGAKEGDNDCAPGDWEEPTLVSFLAIPAGTTFDFPLAKRRPDIEDRLLEMAREYLLGGLVHLGAGAKTSAGYGGLRPAVDGVRVPVLANRESSEATLELTTPAFLAGPHQRADDCELRAATLRGLLRWWWRTFHAGFMEVATLRALEGALWGDTTKGGAVRVEVERISGGPKPEPCAFKKVDKDPKSRDVLRFDESFLSLTFAPIG